MFISIWAPNGASHTLQSCVPFLNDWFCDDVYVLVRCRTTAVCIMNYVYFFFYFCLYTYFTNINFIIFQKHFCFPFSFIKPPWIFSPSLFDIWAICTSSLNSPPPINSFWPPKFLLYIYSFNFTFIFYLYFLHLYSSFSNLYLLVMTICKRCFIDIFSNYAICKFCKCSYHKRCIFGNVNDDQWMCFNCTGTLFPFNYILDDIEFRYSFISFIQWNSLHYFHNYSLLGNVFSLFLFMFENFDQKTKKNHFLAKISVFWGPKMPKFSKTRN